MTIELLIPIAFKNIQHNGNTDVIILAGDIGGTKAHIVLSRYSARGLQTIKESRYATKDFNSFNIFLPTFLMGKHSLIKFAFLLQVP